VKKNSTRAKSSQCGSVSSDRRRNPRSSGVLSHTPTSAAVEIMYSSSICRARRLAGASRNVSVTSSSSTVVIMVARQIAFMAEWIRRSPGLRQSRTKSAIRQVDDVDPTQRVKIGPDDIRQGLVENAGLPRIEIRTDGLAGEVVH